MYRDNFENKLLTHVFVFDPWLDREPGPRKPLFGAIIFEFEGGYCFYFKSPLKYKMPGWPELDGDPESFELTVPSCCIPMMCDAEQVKMHRGLLVERFGGMYGGTWRSLWSCNDGDHLPSELYPELAELKGRRLISFRLFTRRSFEMQFEGFGPIYFKYLADLDGCIQVANGGWHFAPTEINVHGPEYAFGYLSDRAPFPISMGGKMWRSVEHYVQAAVRRAGRGGRVVTLEELRSFALLAREAKFEQHPELRRRAKGKRAVTIILVPGESVC
jgi:hypothetical protein